MGTSDLRASKYGQDLLPGEIAFVNGFGSRLALREKSVALNHGGGFLSFDSKAKTVSLVGIPSSVGGSAPYLSISTASIGMVSASGQASVTASGSGVTLSGSTVAIDAGRVDIGKGAAEPIVTYSMMLQLVAQISASLVALGRPPVVPPVPGRRVFVPVGG